MEVGFVSRWCRKSTQKKKAITTTPYSLTPKPQRMIAVIIEPVAQFRHELCAPAHSRVKCLGRVTPKWFPQNSQNNFAPIRHRTVNLFFHPFRKIQFAEIAEPFPFNDSWSWELIFTIYFRSSHHRNRRIAILNCQRFQRYSRPL
jgi:hypothetical protein